MKRAFAFTAILLVGALLGGCGNHYVTPGGGVSMLAMTGSELVDGDIERHYETQPAALFPASIALIRIQDSGYQSHSYHGYGQGRYTTITTRNIESDASMERLQQLPNVRGVAPIGRMLVPVNANTIKDLRVPAAKLHADMVLVYSVDTTFTVDGQQLGPLSLISLGLIPNKKAHVTATVAGLLVDVRTGYIYGTAESTDIQEQKATIWATDIAIDTARLKAEINAFDGFVGEFEAMWGGVVRTHATAQPSYQGREVARPGYHTVRFDD